MKGDKLKNPDFVITECKCETAPASKMGLNLLLCL